MNIVNTPLGSLEKSASCDVYFKISEETFETKNQKVKTMKVSERTAF